ncbi:hypothetical protein AV530_001512 [Patagioenas fasciata monilis]|uniref:Uncharacterized protein n=1 Tax=Patagioenas fasciata monilis TaxID=372326 RepID=A0A1V4KR19_PATFA|nr:hypothetical protein AV530_001512 [Patagioenas fasciata monilis]
MAMRHIGESWLFVVRSSQAKGSNAEDVERCCGSKGDTIQGGDFAIRHKPSKTLAIPTKAPTGDSRSCA